jgi:ferrochelatase
MRLIDEPAHSHDTRTRIGVLAINLGTPEAPTAAAVRPYLAEFLADPRVVEIPRLVWKYASIWMPDGSPLMVWSRRQASVLQGMLGERCKSAGLPADHVKVELAMRYGRPSIASGLDVLKKAGCDRILLYPLYPQYASATTATACDAAFAHLHRYRWQPGVRVIDRFHDDPGYIGALAARINEYWMRHRRPDKLLLSFHGVPRFSLDRGDPYHCQCQKTARLLRKELGMRDEDVLVTFQSRFGRTEWLQPYTSVVLHDLGKKGTGRVDVFCPGFVADCLETLEEIALEGKREFVAAGGGELNYIPALNDHPAWYEAMTAIAWKHLQGWLDAPANDDVRAQQRERAKAMGASG